MNSPRIKQHLPKLRSDSFQKYATASQTIGFEKQSSLRTDSSQPPLRGGTLIFKTSRGARAAVKKSLIQIKQISQYRYQYINVVYNSLYMFFIFIYFSLRKCTIENFKRYKKH